MVSAVFKVAGFTYGPLLGLFAFGLLSKTQVKDRWVPYICILAPIVSFIIDRNAAEWFGGYQFGFEILIVNAALTVIGLKLLKSGKA